MCTCRLAAPVLSSCERPLTTPHGKTPTTGSATWYRCIASPTRRITPVSLPAVKIHALADCAAETIPRSKAT